LTAVYLCGASGVTDAGVCALFDRAHATLRCVDAVGCAAVSHASVAHARALGAPPNTLRRLPAWFARRWRCVRHRRIPANELHQYFADGTFRFARAAQASGCVLSYAPAPAVTPEAPPLGYFHLIARYDDEAALAAAGLPDWRPGVCIRQVGAHGMHTAQRTSLADNSCPERMPDEDEDGICTGVWRAEEEAAGTPAASQEWDEAMA
jgi:hypothetical protein